VTDVAFPLSPHPDRTLRRLLVAVFVAALCLCAGRAWAASPRKAGASDEPAAGRKRTVLRFGEDDIHGDLTRPDGELVQAPRKPAQPSLVRVRRNFLDRALSGAQRGQ
jgi:hypothetical protein